MYLQFRQLQIFSTCINFLLLTTGLHQVEQSNFGDISQVSSWCKTCGKGLFSGDWGKVLTDLETPSFPLNVESLQSKSAHPKLQVQFILSLQDQWRVRTASISVIKYFGSFSCVKHLRL